MSEEMERVTFRLPATDKEQLEAEDHVNVSGIMRSLAQSYLLTGDAVEVGLERRLKDAESELERLQIQRTRLEHDIEKKQREIDRIEKRIEERRQSIPDEVFDFADQIEDGSFPSDNLEPDNLGVQRQSKNAGLSPRQFVREVEDVLERGGDE